MYTTTKNPPREAVLFPGGVLSRKSEQMFHVKHFAGSWRAAGPAARSAAETGGARLPAGTAGGLRPEYRPLAGTLRGCTAEARTSDISDLQEFERAR